MSKNAGNAIKYTFVSLFVILVLIGSMTYFLYTTINNLKERSFSQIQTLTAQKVAIINTRIDAEYEILGNAAAYLEETGGGFPDVTETAAVLDGIVGENKFMSAGLADIYGNAVLYDGSETNVLSTDYFSHSAAGENSLKYINSDGGIMVFSVPFYDGENIVGVVFGSYYVGQFFENIVNIEADGDYLLLSDVYGNLMAKSGECEILDDYDNLFVFLEDAKLSNDVSVRAIKSDFSAGITDTAEYKYGGETMVAAYVPLGRNGWYIVNVSSGGPFTARDYTFWLGAGTLLLEIFVVFGCLVWYIISESGKNEKLIENEKHFYKMNEAHLRKLEAFSDNIIFEIDLIDDTIRFNDNFKSVFGRNCDVETMSGCLEENDYVYPEDRAKLSMSLNQVARGIPQDGKEYRVKNAAGQYIWTRIEAMLLRDINGIPRKILGKISNIDSQVRAMYLLKSKAEKDQLTDLYNHISMKARVEDYLLNEGKGQLHAFIIIDVDDFKHVNDNYGHFEGDMVLKAFAREISKTFRSGDIVGRLGGDEFAVFLKNIGSREICAQKAEALWLK